MRSVFMIAFGAAALAGASLQAQIPTQPPVQTPPTAGRRGHQHRSAQGGMQAALFRGVTLSDAQRSQLSTISARYREERRSLRANRASGVRPDSASRAASRSGAHDLRQRELADLRGVLTPAQQATFDRNASDWRANARARHAARGAAGRQP